MASELTAAELEALEGLRRMWSEPSLSCGMHEYTGLVIAPMITRLVLTVKRADAAEARVRELEAEVSKWMQDHHSECAKVQELEEALAFYADRKTYTYDNELDEIRVFVDGGNRARTALGKESRT